jgi:hypothetical protein
MSKQGEQFPCIYGLDNTKNATLKINDQCAESKAFA